QDLLELAHFVTRLKLVPGAGADDPALAGERLRGLALAQRLGMPVLARAWQMLLKGIAEVQHAPSPLQAAEMVLVRLAYVADLPAPADLVRTLAAGEPSGGAPAAVPRSGGAMAPSGNGSTTTAAPRFASSPDGASGGGPRLALREALPEA